MANVRIGLLDRVPLRAFAPAGVCRGHGRGARVSSAPGAVSSPCLVRLDSSPPGSTRLTPRALGLGQQLLGQILLINRLTRHGIEHHARVVPGAADRRRVATGIQPWCRFGRHCDLSFRSDRTPQQLTDVIVRVWR